MAKPQDIKRIILALFLILVSSWLPRALAGNSPEAETVSVTGKLQRVAAIGGETTGWALVLDAPLMVDSQALRRVEVDPAKRDIAKFEDRRVEIVGAWQKYSGIERGSYRVILIKEIKEKNAGK